MSSYRDLLGLVWIELRRSYGWVFALGIVLASAPVRRWSDVSGAETWQYLHVIVNGSALSFGIVGGYAGWIASRPRRLLTQEMLQSCDRFHENQIVPDLLAVSATVITGWLVAFLLPTATVLLSHGTPSGLFPLGLLLVLLLSTLASVFGGYVIGLIAPRLFAAPIAAIVVFEFWSTLSRLAGSFSGLDAIVPHRAQRVIYGDPRLPTDHALLLEALAFFALLAITAVCATLLVRKRNLLRTGVSAAFLILTMMAGSQAAATAADGESPSGQRYTHDTPVCLKGQQAQICVHPLDEAMATQSLPMVDRVIAPVADLPGVPTTLVGHTIDPAQFAPPTANFLPGTDARQTFGFALQIVSGTEVGTIPSTSQVVVACWLAGQDATVCPVLPRGTAEGTAMERNEGGNITPALDKLASDMEAAITNFTSLDPAQRQTWLERNWEQLRAGSLPLDQLP